MVDGWVLAQTAGEGSSGISALDIITLVIAMTGAATGIAALGWGIAQHRLTGARVKVSLVGGWFYNGGIIVGGLDTLQRPNEDLGDAVVGVLVRNVGRLPATVTIWGVRAGETSFHSDEYHYLNPAIPHRLEAGEEATWYVGSGAIVRQAHAAGKVLGDARLGARVVLGTGDEIRAKKTYPPSVLERLAP
jgi:hypothetical protein